MKWPRCPTTIRPAATASAWRTIVARATAASGIVTAEVVPAFQAIGPGLSVGGLRLADPPR